mmetsp:Transcript_28854/g.44573  ORF Transcript_28854/g.44573 Transcript_28854/m.44573 type:complete len:666 (+) Transcript_28854:103-2100(+)
MSSSKRPGTVDYSKWDHFDDSDGSEDEEDFDTDDRNNQHDEDDDEDEESYGDDSEEEDDEEYSSTSEDEESGSDDGNKRIVAPRTTSNTHPQRRSWTQHNTNRTMQRLTRAARPNVHAQEEHHSVPPPSLAALQRAWNTNISTITRPCSNCFQPDAKYRCSRCQLVRYCNVTCQVGYHPIHKLECIDAGQHQRYWGIFDGKKNEGEGGDGVDDFVVLRARRSSKRRRALQRAAAAAAVERARRARMAQGGAAKGGGGKGKGAEEREEECSICQSEFTVRGDGGVAFCCPTSHYMCNECSGIWVNSVMSDLDTSFPPKCPMCKALFSQDLFVRQLTSSQQNTFKTHVARTALKEGEELIECKECGLFEVVTDDPVLWWCPHCHCGACRVCNKDLPTGANKYDIDKSPHKKCAQLREPKRLIEQAIEEGSKMRCPGCQLAGRKDDACTHMTCTKCSTEWCYVCGLDVASCDKEAPRDGGRVNDIYLHNRDWEINEKRCPMYLTMILEVDLHWLGENWEENATNADFEDDEKCLDYLHRFRTIKLLQQVLGKIGKSLFINAFVEFDGIKNCGYTVSEVMSTCTDQLIDRRDFLESRGIRVDQDTPGGMAFEEVAQGAALDEDDDAVPMDVDAFEQRLVDEAVHRSEETAAEDDQLRQALARSAEASGL